MAYYPYNSAREAVQPITVPGGASGVGAYYPWNSAHEPLLPINGLGTADQSLADEELRRLLGRAAPVAIVSEWAEQRTDLVWRPVAGRSQLTLLPLTEASLAAARKASGGNAVASIGILGQEPITQARARAAFDGTPYRLSLALAVYSLSDKRPLPRALFLWIATLRDPMDRGGGGRQVSGAARAFGGELVYIVELPLPTGARAPAVAFHPARLTRSLKQDPATEEQQAASPSAISLLPWFVGGAVIAGAGWWFATK